MLSYKTWRELNENTSFTLGLGSVPKVGQLRSEAGFMGDMGGGDMGGSDMGGGDMPKLPMKKKKKPMPMGDKGDDQDFDPDSDVEEHPDDDMDGDGDEEGHDHDDMGDDSDDMGGGGDEEGHDHDDMGDDSDDMGGGGDMGKPSFKKKPPVPDMQPSMMKKGMCKHCMKYMKKEASDEFLDSLRRQAGSSKFAVDEAGDWQPVTEDALIPPSDPNQAVVDQSTSNEPKAGEIGYAPQGRVGSIGSFSEWATKYKK
jgi:hypothetical protein